jgi:hypothetical protein
MNRKLRLFPVKSFYSVPFRIEEFSIAGRNFASTFTLYFNNYIFVSFKIKTSFCQVRFPFRHVLRYTDVESVTYLTINLFNILSVVLTSYHHHHQHVAGILCVIFCISFCLRATVLNQSNSELMI